MGPIGSGRVYRGVKSVQGGLQNDISEVWAFCEQSWCRLFAWRTPHFCCCCC
jgi:hypothetical protein